MHALCYIFHVDNLNTEFQIMNYSRAPSHPVFQILVKIADVAYPYQKPAKRVERILSYMERYLALQWLAVRNRCDYEP